LHIRCGLCMQAELNGLEDDANLPIEEVIRRMKQRAEAEGDDEDDDDDDDEGDSEEESEEGEVDEDDDDEDEEDDDDEDEDEGVRRVVHTCSMNPCPLCVVIICPLCCSFRCRKSQRRNRRCECVEGSDDASCAC
jgi:hypothetical protein